MLLGYTPFLDGLRAFSILYVLCFHGMGPFTHYLTGKCGWVGVDNFFVISGFLITCLLVGEQQRKGNFSIRNYFIRRLLRIAPAYYVLLAFMLFRAEIKGDHILGPIAISAFYLTDYDLAFNLGSVARTHLHPLWSLAVEEKFYLVYPLILTFGRRQLMPLLAVLTGAVELWKAFLIQNHAPWLRISAAFDTHIDIILIGCLAGAVWSSSSYQPWLNRYLKSKICPYLLGGLVLLSSQTIGHPGDFDTVSSAIIFWLIRLPAHACIFALLILSLLTNASSLLVKFLSAPVLVWFGKLSYSLYLWHMFAFDLIDLRFSGFIPAHSLESECVKLVLSVAFASASYYLIEIPFLKLKHRFEHRQRPEHAPSSNKAEQLIVV